MEWWCRMTSPMRRVWIRVVFRLRMRKSGLKLLRKEVVTCEYEDVHVMWEMLRRTDAEIGRYPPVEGRRRGPRKGRRHVWEFLERASIGALCCSSTL